MTSQQLIQSGWSHHQAGRLVEAEKSYRQILETQPDHVGALNLLGVLAVQTGRFDVAVNLIRRAIRLLPDSAEAHYNLGLARMNLGQFDEAIAECRQAIQFNPDLAEAYHCLGNALKNTGQLNEAIAAFRQAIRLKADYAIVHNNLGNALNENGQFDEAIASYQQAIRLNAEFAEAHFNLGIALNGKGKVDEAIAAYRQAIRLKPEYAEAHNNLGNALDELGQLDAATASYRRAIRFKPDLVKAQCNLGNVLKDTGQLDEAIACYQQAIRINSDYIQGHTNLILDLHYHPANDAKMIYEEHRRWNQRHAEPLRKFIRPHTNNRDPDRRLRIGYVSADFRNHSVGRFLLPLFSQHDHGACEIVCYSDVLKSDGMTDRLRACSDGWQNIVGWTEERIADKVRENDIDILVDLAGHTAGNRLRVFARKPAPVQVTYLGYPGSTGLSEIDYRLTDSLADPPGQTESLHSEKLLRLPVCNWCYGEPDDAPAVEPLPAQAEGSICFGTFNNFAKASSAIMDLWAAILMAIPSSRLIIKSRGLGEESVRERINQSFASRGMQADRLEIRGHEPNIVSHLAAYNQVDIALDTFPYHGTATTCEALWMGVPVVSLAGLTHVSRVGVSLLNSVGLPELIAQTPQQYVEIAVGLARDLPRLADLRRNLRPRMQASRLMDAPRFARDVEAAYRQMWRTWCAQDQKSGIQSPAT
jgi:protein O-GlcNAc transferase